jgi:hypothetical protein
MPTLLSRGLKLWKPPPPPPPPMDGWMDHENNVRSGDYDNID